MLVRTSYCMGHIIPKRPIYAPIFTRQFYTNITPQNTHHSYNITANVRSVSRDRSHVHSNDSKGRLVPIECQMSKMFGKLGIN